MASMVYIICALLSLACAILLLRGFKQNRIKLLFWSSFGFIGFCLNNVLLFVNLHTPQDLSVARTIPALIGMVVMVYGLITETV